jgi:hypothetical protein
LDGRGDGKAEKERDERQKEEPRSGENLDRGP